MNKQEQDLDTGKWYWRDEYVESLEAEAKQLKADRDNWQEIATHWKENEYKARARLLEAGSEEA